MDLWTYQGHGFDLVTGKHDISKSQYNTEARPTYAAACRKLAEYFKCDFVIWCGKSGYSEDIWSNVKGRARWELSVPDEQVEVMNDFVWHYLIGEDRAAADHKLILDTCIEEDLDPDQHYDSVLQRFQHRDDPWGNLFAVDCKARHAQLIVPGPVKEQWVTRRPNAKAD